jgi:hypothetical protein
MSDIVRYLEKMEKQLAHCSVLAENKQMQLELLEERYEILLIKFKELEKQLEKK